MSTYMLKQSDIQRKWYIIDAANKPLGRVAAQVAVILRGKHKPTFTPHMDCGDHVIVINAKDAVLTGNKLNDKYYIRHTGHIGGLKQMQYKILMQKKPEMAMMLAVKGMLPHNTVGSKSLTRLRVYKDNNHNHQSQQPVEWTGEIK